MTRDTSPPARAGSARLAIRSPSRVRAVGRGAWRIASRRPALMLGGVAVAFGAGAFAWNVLLTQPNRHPAPLFAAAKPAPVAVEPPKRPAELAAAAVPAAPPRTEPSPGPVRTELPRPGGDGIAAMLRTGPNEPANPRPPVDKTGSVSNGQARVAQAQKALVKLGYGPIAADGKIGAGTRQALEKFERDRKLPVTGSLGPRTSKQLADLSGMTLP